MSGLLMIGLFITWVLASVMLSRWFGCKFCHPTARTAVAFASFVVLLVLPVADELIGMWQLDALCKGGSTLKINAERIRGRTIRVVIRPSWAQAAGTAIPISYSRYSYQDTTTGEELASYTSYDAKGGWLIRSLGLFDSNVPLVITKPWCAPEGHSGIFAKQYGFNVIN